MTLLLTLFYFILALLLLIIVHEYGHFIVARWCGVKVLRFSFGFGKVLASWRDKRGTEYVWSLFPLGGYVKMLDESEGPVPENERHLAFNNKSMWARAAIVLAGPLFNFLFAFVALWLVLVIGIKSLAPMIDKVKPGSIAAQAGLTAKQEIVALDGKTVASWRDFQYALMPLLGTHDPVSITSKSLVDGHEKTLTLTLTNWQLDVKKPDVLDSLGIVPFVPTIPPVVGEVVAESPAKNAGLQTGDVVNSVDAKPITDWIDLVEYVRKRPNQRIVLNVSSNGKHKDVVLQTARTENNGKAEGFIGVRSQRVDWPAHWLRLQRETPLNAIGTAFNQTVALSGTTFSLIGRLVTGKLPIQSISGPVGIAQGAGESGRNGLPYYLSFLALVSISLGVLNLLPIPMLDGGHLLYYLIEFIRRRPLSERLKSTGIYVGLVLLIALMIIAFSNDLARLA
jgi:regulator of sigma E protease